ncbi:unnamed protein product, partial [Musa textilis]
MSVQWMPTWMCRAVTWWWVAYTSALVGRAWISTGGNGVPSTECRRPPPASPSPSSTAEQS